MFLIIVISIFILIVTYQIYKLYYPPPNINPDGKYVLITGCGSGLGYALAIELDKQGFNVFASVHHADSEAQLKEHLSTRSVVFVLDITKQEDIDAAYNMVKKKTSTLHALVNNAGVNKSIYIDWMPMEFMRKHMDVNYFGHVAMTKTFLPLLIAKSNSRVVNVSSIYSFAVFAADAAYSPAKSALESFSDCLRREMMDWNLRVSIIEPGNMETPFYKNYEASSRSLWSEVPTDVQQRWGSLILDRLIDKLPDNPLMRNAEDPIKAVRAIQHALISPKPKTRYRPGWQARCAFVIFFLFPDWIVDKLSYSECDSLLPAEIQQRLKERMKMFTGE